MKNYKRLLTYMRPYVKKFALAVVCIILASAANLYVPWIIKDMIDDVLADKNMALLNAICIGIVVIFFLRGIFYFGQSYLVSYIGQKVIIDVREVMFRKFQRMPLAYYDRHQTGEIMSFVTNDVAAIQSALVDNLIDLVTEGCILIGSLALMFYLDWKLSLLTLIVIPMVGQAMKIFGRKIKKSSTVIQERLAEITALLQESFSATRVVKSFVREDYEIDRFVASNQRNFEAVMKNVQQTSMLTPTVEFLAALAVTFIVWFGESVPLIEQAAEWVAQADRVIVVGTSLKVYPAAGLLRFAPAHAERYLVDPRPPAAPGVHIIAATAAEGVPPLVDELLAADIIVAGVPMYNFGPPAQFKAWIDNIVRVGRTFGFDRNREGAPYWPMLTDMNKRVVVLSSRGDYGYDGGQMAGWNHVEPAVFTALRYLGITDAHSVAVEYDEFGDERLQQSLREAEAGVDEVAASIAATKDNQ